MGSFLNRAQLNKLENFEMEKFNELNLKILEDDGSANLAQMMREITKEIMEEREEQKRKGLLLPQTDGLNSAEKRSKATTKRKEVSMASARGGSEISSGEQDPNSEVVRTKGAASVVAEGNVILHEDHSIDDEQQPVTKTKRSSKLHSIDSAAPLDITTLDDETLEKMENEQ